MTDLTALTDRQLRLIRAAAKAVPVLRRAEFLERLARHLGRAPSDAAVAQAINVQLNAIPVEQH
jgi:hypothetical protein